MSDTVKKWEFVPEDTIAFAGRTLTRIRALVDYPNGHAKAGELGGYIEKPENLFDWGWVGYNAKVFDNGLVCDNGQVHGNGQVYGNAEVYNNGRVFGNAQVYENGRVYDNGQVYDEGQVHDEGQVFGYGRVYGNGRVYGEGQVFGNGRVFGIGMVYGEGLVCDVGQVYGRGRVYGSGRVCGNAHVFGIGQVYGYGQVSADGYVENGTDIIVFDYIGSENGTLTAHRQKDGSVNLVRGCFSGSIDEFLSASAKTHRDLPDIKREYELIIEVIKHRFKLS